MTLRSAAALLVLPLAAALHSTPASAAPASAAPGEWQIDAKASYVVMGAHAARATGGMMPSLAARRMWLLNNVSLGLGGELGVFGLLGDASWMGVLWGPVVSVGARPFGAPLSLEASVHLDFGRVPTCTTWGLCSRYLGLFPVAEVGLAHSPTKATAVVASCGVRFIRTLGWSGVSVEPAISGRYFW
jgi:hypothetical protein